MKLFSFFDGVQNISATKKNGITMQISLSYRTQVLVFINIKYYISYQTYKHDKNANLISVHQHVTLYNYTCVGHETIRSI